MNFLVDFYLTMRYSQLAAIRQTAPIRTQGGSGLERDGTDIFAVVQITAIGAPTTKSRPANAARGLLMNAVIRSPSRKAVAARVVPQLGQGIPVSERKTHACK